MRAAQDEHPRRKALQRRPARHLLLDRLSRVVRGPAGLRPVHACCCSAFWSARQFFSAARSGRPAERPENRNRFSARNCSRRCFSPDRERLIDPARGTLGDQPDPFADRHRRRLQRVGRVVAHHADALLARGPVVHRPGQRPETPPCGTGPSSAACGRPRSPAARSRPGLGVTSFLRERDVLVGVARLGFRGSAGSARRRAPSNSFGAVSASPSPSRTSVPVPPETTTLASG